MTVGISIAPRIIERVMRAKVAVVTELDPKIWIDFMNCSDISDEKPPNCLDLLNESMYEVAGQIGAMEPEDRSLSHLWMSFICSAGFMLH